MPKAASRESWTHPSVRALAANVGVDDPVVAIRQKAVDCIARARRFGWSGPPFCPQQLASILGIKCQPAAGLFSEEAQLSPRAGRQLLLEFNPDRPDGRRNYSICHEITHTFFDDCYDRVHFRKTNKRPRYGPEDEIELLCQIGAAELLMPATEFEADLETRAFCLETMLDLRTIYVASKEAVLRRMISLGGRTSAAVFLNRRNSPNEQKRVRAGAAIPMKMRIVYVATSDDFPVYLPKDKSVPDTSCVAYAEHVEMIQRANERWAIDGFGTWAIEAIRLNAPVNARETTPTVAALVVVR